VAAGRVLLAVDGNSLVHRSFHANASTAVVSVQGRPIWAVRGLLLQLVAAVERVGADAVVVGFDDSTASLRRDRWPQYKANRTDKLETLVEQLALAAHALRRLGIAVVVPPGLEADDVLASAAHHARCVGASTVIMTSDRDSFALIDENTRVLRIINGGVEASPVLNGDRLETMLGIRPEQYRDFAALRGDPSDNLPGVHGVGPKTAARLLTEFGGAREAFDEIDNGGEKVRAVLGSAMAAKLADPSARTRWELNCQIMTMHVDVDVEIGVERGLLPLSADVVRAVFDDHLLTANVANALRVLAYRDVSPPPSRRDEDYGEVRWIPPAARPNLTSVRRIVVGPPRPEQLSLFD
jgi:5'-3' exonuclease